MLRTFSAWSLLTLTILISQTVSAQISHEELIRHSIDNSYRLSAQNYDILRTQTLDNKGVAGNLPRVSLSGNARTDVNNIRLQFFDGRDVAENNATNYSAGTSLDVEYPIYEGGAKNIRKQQLAWQARQAEFTYQNAKEEILTNLLNSVADFQLHKSQAEIYAADTTYWSELLELREQMKSMGRGTQTDILQIQSELNNSRIQLQRALQSASIARTRIENIAFLEEDQQIDSSNIRLFLEKTGLSAPERPPAIVGQSEVALRQAETNLALSKSAIYPTISVFAGYGFSWSRNAVGVLLSNQTFGPYGGLNMNWTLYDGKRLQLEKEAAELARLQQRSNLDQVEREIDFLQREIENALREERSIYQKEEKQSQLLREQFEVIQAQYREGRIDILEVLNYQRQYRLSQLNINMANYQIALYLTELMYLKGQLRLL